MAQVIEILQHNFHWWKRSLYCDDFSCSLLSQARHCSCSSKIVNDVYKKRVWHWTTVGQHNGHLQSSTTCGCFSASSGRRRVQVGCERYFSWLAIMALSYWLPRTEPPYTACSDITLIQSRFKTPRSSPVLHTKTTTSSRSFESRLKGLCQRIETRCIESKNTGCCGGISSAGFDNIHQHHSGSLVALLYI